jgi:hypothetical protein
VLVGSPYADLHYRLQILIRDRLNDVPICVEHLNITKTRMRTLLRVIQSVLAAVLTAIDGAKRVVSSVARYPDSTGIPSRLSGFAVLRILMPFLVAKTRH